MTNCTLKKSPDASNTEALAGVVTEQVVQEVAGVVVTGNEDGAHHVISEVQGALADIGYTVPGQAWTYAHLGPGPDYLEEERGRDWSHRTGRAMAANLHGVARALAEHPVGPPPG